VTELLSKRLPFLVILSFVLTACQIGSKQPVSQRSYSLVEQLPEDCTVNIREFRGTIERAGVSNAGAPALHASALLHGDRFLHGLSRVVQSEPEIHQWMSLAAELAIKTRESENNNLEDPWSDSSLARLADCSRSLARAPGFDAQRFEILEAVQQSNFPTHYMRSRQILGALPLLRPFLRQRILALHADEQRWFEEEEAFSSSHFYEIDSTSETSMADSIAGWMRAAYSSNALALPLLQEAQLAALFTEHAPKLLVEFAGENDKISSPQWEGDRIEFNSETPTVYTLPSITRFEGRNLLQLNFVFWFSARRPRALIDLYSGDVDSLIWRVTLNEQGDVLLYDSIHSCGCYHKYFIASEKIITKERADSKEPANIFRLSRDIDESELTLTITANEHYIVGVDSRSRRLEEDSLRFDLAPYEQLQNLAVEGGTRSLFDDNGIIAGSERLERFTLWPTGILSVGAMRQWGTHATGFIEEQFFDDEGLLEKYFELSR
jgi:hypothetical protein